MAPRNGELIAEEFPEEMPPAYSHETLQPNDKQVMVEDELQDLPAAMESSHINLKPSEPPKPIDVRPGDYVIAVMGVTGVGKTTFISHLTKENLVIGHSLEACTSTVGIHECVYKVDKRLFLIDTPGFDDTYKSDTEILRDVSNWLVQAYSHQIELTGIIYLHRILDVRLGGSAMKNLRMFKKLCGDEGLASVVLATTMWGNVDETVGLQREKQLKSQPNFWAGMISKGSRVFRQDRKAESAMDIINYLVSRRRPVVLDIQRQLVDKNMRLEETGAGMEVQAEIAKQKEYYEKRLRELMDEMNEAMRHKDREAQEEVAALRKEIRDKIRKDEEDKIKLRADKEQLRVQMEEQRIKERKEWMEQLREARERENAERERVQAQTAELHRKLEEIALQERLESMQRDQQNNERNMRYRHELAMMRQKHESELREVEMNSKLKQEKESRIFLQQQLDENKKICTVM